MAERHGKKDGKSRVGKQAHRERVREKGAGGQGQPLPTIKSKANNEQKCRKT